VVRLVAYVILLGGIAVAGLWYRESLIDQGRREVQAEWNKNKQEIAAVVQREQEKAAALEEAARLRNEETIRELEKKLAAADGIGVALARRLRDKQRAAASSCPVQKDPDQPRTAEPSGTGNDETLTIRVGAALGECLRNADRFDALLEELVPQLD
jgi:serine/threonine protein kinase HipA of HipAB toxin-antitoxin module